MVTVYNGENQRSTIFSFFFAHPVELKLTSHTPYIIMGKCDNKPYETRILHDIFYFALVMSFKEARHKKFCKNFYLGNPSLLYCRQYNLTDRFIF